MVGAVCVWWNKLCRCMRGWVRPGGEYGIEYGMDARVWVQPCHQPIVKIRSVGLAYPIYIVRGDAQGAERAHQTEEAE